MRRLSIREPARFAATRVGHCYTGRMPRVAPFVALRYDAAVAGPLTELTAPPYDVISEPHRARFAEASRYNVVHLDLADGPAHPDDEDNRYARAAALLASWESARVLRRDAAPAYYVYEVDWPARDRVGAGRIRGVFAALTLEPWGGAVVPHEETMPGPVEDRLRLLRATGTHISPIYGTVRGPSHPLADLLSITVGDPPTEEVIDEEGVRHRLWHVSGDVPIASWLAEEELLIADGHHRYTTALAYRDERHAVDGSGPWDAILTLIVDTGTQHVPVLPYHRVQVSGPPAQTDSTVADLDALDRVVSDEDVRVGVIVRGTQDLSYGTLQLSGPPPAVRALHDEVLDDLAPGDALRFTHSARDAEEAVRDGGAVAAYVLPPTTPDRLMTAIERGDRLPRKSTFFWPKPRTGLLFMPVR
jgi:uncharacterized protein (DUF1015 family)